MARFGATDVLVRRRPARWPILVLAVAIPGLLALLGFQTLAGFTVLGQIIFLFFLPAILTEDSFKGERRIPKLYADREGVFFDRKQALRRDRVAATAVEPTASGAVCVNLWGHREREDLAITLPNQEQARALVEAMDLRPDQHAARFRVELAPLRTPKMARLVRAIVMFFAAGITGGVMWMASKSPLTGLLLVPILFVYFALVRRLRRHLAVTLGSDALVVGRSIPLAAIASVNRNGEVEAFVHLREMGQLCLRFDGQDARDKRDAFISRMEAHLANKLDVAVAAMLAPGERDKTAWLQDLRRIDAGGFRSGGVPTEDLWRVVEHAASPPGMRVGALAMLSSRLEPGDRVRIGALAEATVKPEMRAALEAASEADATDEAILAAFHK